MAQIHNAIARHTALLRGFRTILGFGSAEGGLERAGETLTPIIDLWSRPEWALPFDDILVAVGGQTPAVAGEYGGGAIVNPTGSNRLLTIEAISLSVTVTQRWRVIRALASTITGTYGAVANVPSDTRRAQANILQSFYVGSDAAALAGTGTLEEMVVLANQGWMCTAPPVILAPGTACCAYIVSQNQAGTVNFRYREHPALPGELSV